MASSLDISIPLYLTVKDTEEALGISRRQMTHWVEKELLIPELGLDALRFTERDLKRLTVLKKLIVDRRLPLDFVKEIANATEADFGDPDMGETQYLDVAAGKMRSKRDLSIDLWAEFLLTANESALEDRLHDLWLILVRVLRLQYRTAASYQNRLDEIRAISRELELIGRMEWSADAAGQYIPAIKPGLPDDGLADFELTEHAQAHSGRIKRLYRKAKRILGGEMPDGSNLRLWTEFEVNASSGMIKSGIYDPRYDY